MPQTHREDYFHVIDDLKRRIDELEAARTYPLQVTLPDSPMIGEVVAYSPASYLGSIELLVFDGTAWRSLSSNNPSFRVYRNAAQSRANGETIVWDQVEKDTHGWFNTSTGLYTPLRAGNYRFSWAVRPNAALTADNFVDGQLTKNGTAIKLGQICFQRGATAINSVGSGQADANGTTDTFGVLFSHNQGGSIALQVGNPFTMWFDGEFIGPPSP